MEFDIEKAFVQLRAARKNCVDSDRFFLRKEDTALMNRLVVLIREADPEAAEKVHQIVAGPLVPMGQVAEKMTTEVKLDDEIESLPLSPLRQVRLGEFEGIEVAHHPSKPPLVGGIIDWHIVKSDKVEYWLPQFRKWASVGPKDALEEACREHGVLG